MSIKSNCPHWQKEPQKCPRVESCMYHFYMPCPEATSPETFLCSTCTHTIRTCPLRGMADGIDELFPGRMLKCVYYLREV
jgi:hypothetical protein